MFGQHPPGKNAEFSVSRVSAQVYPRGKKKTLENETDLEIVYLTSHSQTGNKTPFNSLVTRTGKVHPLKLTAAAASLPHRVDSLGGSGVTSSTQDPGTSGSGLNPYDDVSSNRFSAGSLCGQPAGPVGSFTPPLSKRGEPLGATQGVVCMLVS